MKIEVIDWPCGCRAVPRDITNRAVKQSWATAWKLVHCPLHGAAGELRAAIRSAVATLTLCQLPRLDERAASNEEVVAATIEGLQAALALAEPKPEATEGEPNEGIHATSGSQT